MSDRAVAAGAVSAANEFTARWATSAPDRGFLCSGVGVWTLLALLAAGADGEARVELERSIGIPADEALAHARTVLDLLTRPRDVHGAVGVWLADDIVLDPIWASGVPESSILRLTGGPRDDQEKLDGWVRERTMGIVDRMPLRLTEETEFAVATALAISFWWRNQFEDRIHHPTEGPWAGRDWHGLSAEDRDLDRVSVWESVLGPLTILISAGKGDVDVHLVMGQTDARPGDVLAEAILVSTGGGRSRRGSEIEIGETAPGLECVEVETHGREPLLVIRTMAFELDVEHDLVADDRFGLGAATDRSRGHFSGMSTHPLAVDEARQAVRAEFSAEGFRAAAVSGMMLRAGAALIRPPAKRLRVTFDRPFGFLAVDRGTGLVLLAGWVAEPSPVPDALRSWDYSDLMRQLGWGPKTRNRASPHNRSPKR